MKITILTLFPEFFNSFFDTSIIKRAISKEIVSFEVVNIRDFTLDKYHRVDNPPVGGGAGLIMMCQPVIDALNSVKTPHSKTFLTSPKGNTFNQQKALEMSKEEHLIFICGHYEGFDERIRDYVDIQMSLGDFVLTGGESACMVMCDCILRILPGVIRQDSSDDDSFSNGLLEYPQYTRPEVYNGKRVPDVLLSGHHANIKKYRHEESLKRTALYRPDLLENLELDKEDQKVVDTVLKNKN